MRFCEVFIWILIMIIVNSSNSSIDKILPLKNNSFSRVFNIDAVNSILLRFILVKAFP